MKQSYIYYVYLLLCSDRTIYTGVTNDLDRRLSQHELGTNKESYTYKRRPIKLIHQEVFNDIREAIAREKQVQKWSRAKKLALCKEDYDAISRLAKSSVKKRAGLDRLDLTRK